MEAFLGVWKYNASTLGGDNDPMLRQNVINGLSEEDYKKGGEVEVKLDGNKVTFIIRPAGKPEQANSFLLGEKQVVDGPGGQKVESEMTLKDDCLFHVYTMAGVTFSATAFIKDGNMFSELSTGGKTVTATVVR